MELGRSIIAETELRIVSVSIRVAHTSQQRSQTGTVGFIHERFSGDISHGTVGDVRTDTQIGIYALFLDFIAG